MNREEVYLHFSRLRLGRARGLLSGAGALAGVAAVALCLLRVFKRPRAAQGGRA